ncbi:MAG: hypothetical protein KGJ23_08275 [Euryarchaeota archaeon]|nr:hypothetical protein [Euryarchaeota archaeon]MDE1836598.1 hypothetical protein [Euryarchaeota archaeon]MDE1879207.1 hypothetical protein [Euryarchaeota archaeon]MDE2044568.1 hypothetical protein [Thermoplasmata archaeon]
MSRPRSKATAPDPLTKMTLRDSTVRMLRQYKRPGESWDDVFTRFIEDHPPEAFLKEMERRTREEKSYPIEELLKKARLVP